MNERPSESFYSKLKEFDSDLIGPFKNFFDYHKDEIIFADFTQKEAKENDEMKVKIASIGLNAEKDKKGAERKRIEARSGKILDGCLVINIFIKSDGSLQIKQEKNSEIWFSEINKQFIIFEKDSDNFYEKNIYIEFFKGLGEIYYKHGNREKTKFSFGIRGIYERNPVTFQIQKLILDYCAKKDRFYSEIKKEMNELLANEADIENIFKNYHITLFDKEICSKNEYFRLLLEKEEKEMKEDASYNSDNIKLIFLERIKNLEKNKDLLNKINYNDFSFLGGNIIFLSFCWESKENSDDRLLRKRIESILMKLQAEKANFSALLTNFLKKKNYFILEQKFDWNSGLLKILVEESKIYNILSSSADDGSKIIDYLREDFDLTEINLLKIEALNKFLRDFEKI